MAENREALWTIEKLGGEVARVLSVGFVGQPNGRIREVPDQRTIRYYTTLGLIDRPAEMRGRTALYGKKHLLQLVAIKRLQAEGLSLAAIQARLAGATPRSLGAIARLGQEPSASGAGGEAVAPLTPKTGRGAGAFWGELPMSSDTETRAPAKSRERTADDRPPLAQAELRSHGPKGRRTTYPGDLMTGLRMGEDVLLVFSQVRELEEEDLEALEKAAAPLMRSLETRGLIRPSKDQKGENR